MQNLIDEAIRTNSSIVISEYNQELLDFLVQHSECQMCGKCCGEFWNKPFVAISKEDVMNIADFLDVKRKVIKKKTFVNNDGTRLLPSPCPFFDKSEKKCTIYVKRPFGCFLYPIVLIKEGSDIKISINPQCANGRNLLQLVLK